MHLIQRKLLKLLEKHNFNQLTLRQIGKLIGEKHPQKIKHHLDQLEKKGFVRLNKESGLIKKIKQGIIKETNFVAVPILGSANCGEATILADENLEGFLKISRRLLKKKRGIFAIKAEGSSMNKANIDGESIEDGDYVIIDSTHKKPTNGDYVLSIIGEVANIKKFIFNKKKKQIILLSESTIDLPPIYIHPKDFSEYMISGKVIQVIKKPT